MADPTPVRQNATLKNLGAHEAGDLPIARKPVRRCARERCGFRDRRQSTAAMGAPIAETQSRQARGHRAAQRWRCSDPQHSTEERRKTRRLPPVATSKGQRSMDEFAFGGSFGHR